MSDTIPYYSTILRAIVYTIPYSILYMYDTVPYILYYVCDTTLHVRHSMILYNDDLFLLCSTVS
jgi:hypothetical protein